MKLREKFILHAAWDFTSCNTVEEQVQFVLRLAEDPLGIGIPAHEIKVDNGAAQFLALLSQYAHCVGLSFQNRTKLESRCIQFLPRTFFYTGGDEKHRFSRYPKKPFRSMWAVIEQLRDYSPAWLKTHKHDFTDALLLALYEPYKPLPSAVGSSFDFMDVLGEATKASRSLSARNPKPIRKLARETAPRTWHPSDEVIKKSLKRKEVNA